MRISNTLLAALFALSVLGLMNATMCDRQTPCADWAESEGR